MPLIEGPSLGGNARHVLRQYAEENALARERTTNAAGNEEFGGGCLRGRYNNLRETVQPTPSIVVVPSLINAGGLFVQRPVCRTNYLVNNAMLGATGSVLPTAWASGAIPAGFTFSVGASGQATADDGTVVDYVDITVSGTATASGAFNIFFGPASGTVQNPLIGQTFALSTYTTCISGDITTPAMVLQVQEVSGSTFQAGTSTNIALASGAPLQRVSAIRTLNQANVTAVRGRIGHPIVSGTAYSYTLRIGSPQLERLGRVTPMIRTGVSVTGAVTVLNESSNVIGLPPDFTVSRNTTATRVNSSGLIESVASGVPRIDWLGQSCPALLVEASGQNLAFQSQAFDVSGNWTQSNVTVTPNVTATLDPAGGNTADLLADSVTTGSTSHRIYTTPVPASAGSISVVSGTTYSTSLFVKAGTSSVLRIVLRRDNEAVIGIGDTIFNVTSGTITSGSGTIENYGNGWYRCTNIGTSNFTGSARIFINLYDTAGNQSYIGTAGTNNMYIWGAQLETGAVATTYIPTTTAAVTRAADVISASGALVSGLIGQTEGTIYWEGAINSIDRIFFSLTSGTSNSQVVRLQTTGAGQMQLIVQSGTIQANIYTAGAITVGQFYKVAVAYKQDDFVLYLNGAQVGTDTSGSLPTGLSQIQFSNAGATDLTNQRCRAAAIYTTRLSNAQLAELTRL